MEGGFAPFSFRTKSGKLSGFEVALAKDVAKQLKLKPVFVQTKFDSLISGLDTKKYDVVYNDMSITPERQKAYTFGREYLFTKSVLITKKGSDIKTYGDLKGKRAAETTSSNFSQAAKKAGAQIVAAPGFAEQLELVANGKADVVLNSQDSWTAYKKVHPETNLQATVTNALGQTTAAPMLNKHNKQLAKKISQAQRKLEKDGSMKQLSEKYFGADLTKK